MENIILVAGATGSLGEKICRELQTRGANVRALIRPESNPEKTEALKEAEIETLVVDFSNSSQLAAACSGVSCVVSSLAGLKETIVEVQTQLLDAAVEAGVPRFIPSDFCTDYTQLPEGSNRNFDLRKTFTALAEKRPVRLTSVFNGAFSHVLRFGIPLLNTKEQSIAFYDGKADWKIDFTSLEDTAAFTAEAALDDTAPRYLRIAGFRVSPEDLVRLSGKIFGTPFQLQNQGSLEQFSETIQKVRTAHPEGEQELYPAWQQMQYLYSMFAAHHDQLDNARYPGLKWQNAEETLRSSYI